MKKKKDKTMYKSSFVKGAFITTLGIVIAKILGILYVIPFHAIIGDEGGALYGYAYTIYLVFMSLSTAGIPLAISKVISEYQTLGYMKAKKRAFFLGKSIAFILGLVSFIILMICAPLIAKSILGNITGGNTLADVTFVIRVISTAILIVPVLSIYRGYFEGHRLFSPPSISQVIEQIIRVSVIIFGSYFVLKSFNMNIASATGMALFGATLGAIGAYLYLAIKRFKNKRKFNQSIIKVNEPIVKDSVIIKKIVIYALPFIMIDIFKSLYNYVDMVTVVKGLVSIASFNIDDAEVVFSMLSTWSNKFNMILLAISSGVIVSLIPNLTKSVVEKDQKDINKKINQAIGVLLYLMVPMAVGISFLSKSIWILFYGDSIYGPSVLAYYIFAGLLVGIFTAVVSIMQTLKDYKVVFISLISGLLLKILLNTSLISAFYKLGLPPYYGVITASILGYLVSITICIIVLKKKYDISFEENSKNIVNIVFSTILMSCGLVLLSLIIPTYTMNRVFNIVIIGVYAIIGMIIYFGITYKTKTIKDIFGDRINKFIKIKRNN